MRKTALILLLLVALGADAASAVAAEGMYERALTDSSFSKKMTVGVLRFYKKFLSPVNGDRCRMQPTCSEYAIHAVRKHGLVVGVILAVDRLMREGEEIHRGLPVLTPKGLRYPDPLESNDLWMGDDHPQASGD